MTAKKRALGWAGAGLVLAAVLIWAAYFAPDLRASRANFAFTLNDVSGRQVQLADFKGKPLIVNFWATWCGPCMLETPELVELSAEYKGRINIVGISYDDTPDEVKKFAAEYQVPYPLLIGKDREDVFTAFGLGAGIPTTVFVRADGTIATRLQGINNKAWFRKTIDGLF